MNAQAKAELASLIEESDWMYLRSKDGELSLCWGFRGQTYQWDMSLRHESDLQFALHGIGTAAADASSAITWVHAAIATAWLRQAFYGGIQ